MTTTKKQKLARKYNHLQFRVSGMISSLSSIESQTNTRLVSFANLRNDLKYLKLGLKADYERQKNCCDT